MVSQALGGVPRFAPQATTPAAQLEPLEAATIGFQVDQERLTSDPAYKVWYEDHRDTLVGAAARAFEAGRAAHQEQTSKPKLLLGALRGGARGHAGPTQEMSADVSVPAPALHPESSGVQQPTTSVFVPDNDRLSTDPAYRDWYEQHKEQLTSVQKTKGTAHHIHSAHSEPGEAGLSQFEVSNPLRSGRRNSDREPAGAARNAATTHESEGSAFEVDRARLQDDPQYAAWYRKHAHKLNASFKSSALSKALTAGRGQRRSSAKADTHTSRQSMSPLAVAAQLTAQSTNPVRFAVDEQRLHADDEYRAWYEQHKHMLQ